jgi:hypothetical protein
LGRLRSIKTPRRATTPRILDWLGNDWSTWLYLLNHIHIFSISIGDSKFPRVVY